MVWTICGSHGTNLSLRATLYSPGPCSYWVPLWSCCADSAGIPHSDSYLPCCDATRALLCPSTPRWNVLTPGGGWVSGLSESAFHRPTVCRTAGILEGLTWAAVQTLDLPAHVSVGPVVGASQCSSGTLRSHPPAQGQSAGSAAGRTGTPLLQDRTSRQRAEDKECC